jgi:hypothetical protein
MLKDNDLMPFGKHKGDRMEYVPAQHLLALYEGELFQEDNENHRLVKAYVIDNLQALRAELKKEREEFYRQENRK